MDNDNHSPPIKDLQQTLSEIMDRSYEQAIDHAVRVVEKEDSKIHSANPFVYQGVHRACQNIISQLKELKK